MTEPLTTAQLASIGWSNRQGLADSANQFHYYRLTGDNRILFGGYDAVYHFGGKVRPEYEDRIESHRRLASHFFTTFPQLEGLRFTHRWAGAIDSSSRFCAFFGTSPQRPRRLRDRIHRARRRRPRASRPTSCSTSSPVRRPSAPSCGWCARSPSRSLPNPPRRSRQPGAGRDEPGRPQRGQAQPVPQDARRRRNGLRLVNGLAAGAGVDAGALALDHEPLPAEEVLAGSPTTAVHELATLGGIEVGIWEMTPGTATDTEADEVFVVLSGRATIAFASSGLPDLEVGPGSGGAPRRGHAHDLDRHRDAPQDLHHLTHRGLPLTPSAADAPRRRHRRRRASARRRPGRCRSRPGGAASRGRLQ